MASTASGAQAAASPANSSRLSSSRSGAASITSSQPPRSASSPAREPAARRAASASASRPAATLGAASQVRAQALDPALERLGVRVVEQRLVAAETGQLGDPGAHRPGARDSDPLDHASARPGAEARRPRTRPRRGGSSTSWKPARGAPAGRPKALSLPDSGRTTTSGAFISLTIRIRAGSSPRLIDLVDSRPRRPGARPPRPRRARARPSSVRSAVVPESTISSSSLPRW